MLTWCVLLSAAFAGGLLQASSGFGYALICMCAFSMVLPVKTALVLQPTVAAIIIAWYAFRLRRNINFRLLLVPAGVALLTTFCGMQLAAVMDAALLKRCLGVALTALCGFSLLKKGRIRVSKGFLGQAMAGGISGFLGGLTNMSGPPMVLYMLEVTDSKEEYSGTLQAYFVTISLFKIIVNFTSGRMTADLLIMIPPLLAASVAGSLVGFLLFRRMNMQTVKTAVNVILMVAGLYYVFF